MADEETREDADTPEGRDGNGRARWPVITGVAVAVAVVAGGLYGVSGLLGGDGDEDGAPAGTVAGDASAPLLLDGLAASRVDAQWDADTALELAGPGALRLAGDPPDGPERAAAYGFAEVTEEQVAGLAEVFGLDGEVSGDGGTAWTVPGSEPDGASLTVTGQAPGSWSYGGAIFTSDLDMDPADPDASVASPEMPVDDAGGSPPSEREALDAAGPLLDELGLSGAELDATLTVASQRVVRAFPVVDGLPVHGLATELHVDADGEVTSATGALAAPEAGEEREVTRGAAEAVEEYNETLGDLPVPEIACAEPAPDDAREPAAEQEPVAEPGEPVPPAEPETAPACPSDGEKPAPTEVTAEFGLALHYSGQEPVLVPSWLFAGTLTAGVPVVVSHPAVAVEYGTTGGTPDTPAPAEPAEPAEPADPGSGAGTEPGDPGESPDVTETGWSVAPYEESDTELTLRFWGGVCDEYAAVAEESDDEITVTLEATNPDPTRQCILVAEEQTTEISLDEPVGTRTLVDERGEPIPVR
ncbi:hypothetical protein [Streptomyces specialis]|uniref:hypothetical protein n=1 Tax=Streptomyces specialis TaxID=498367 RepID=UPI00073EA0B5|nr:hypothetical protein [Streptomyces specialis]